MSLAVILIHFFIDLLLLVNYTQSECLSPMNGTRVQMENFVSGYDMEIENLGSPFPNDYGVDLDIDPNNPSNMMLGFIKDKEWVEYSIPVSTPRYYYYPYYFMLTCYLCSLLFHKIFHVLLLLCIIIVRLKYPLNILVVIKLLIPKP